MRKLRAAWYRLSYRTRTRVVDYALATGIALAITWVTVVSLS